MAGAQAAAPSRAKLIIDLLGEQKMTISTAESCTGGLLSAALTGVPGSSKTFHGGFVTYSNEAKVRMIGVSSRTIRDYGAVSAQVARAMADGARNTARTGMAISITGVAGPTGGSEKKPVGLVFLACATTNGTNVVEKRFGDIGRDRIREASVEAAMDLILEMLRTPIE